MKIAILGANGFVGSNVALYLQQYYPNINTITRENYTSYKGNHYDYFINCNGNSKKYWANENPIEDFEASVTSVYKTFFDFSIYHYIYMSSLDIYYSFPYGFHKRIAEDIIQNRTLDRLFLRCGSIIGPHMKKGVLYDILHDKPLYVTEDSKFQFISVFDIARCIYDYIQGKYMYYTRNLGTPPISVKTLGLWLDKSIQYHPSCSKQHYNHYTSYPSEKNIKEYILTNI